MIVFVCVCVWCVNWAVCVKFESIRACTHLDVAIFASHGIRKVEDAWKV